MSDHGLTMIFGVGASKGVGSALAHRFAQDGPVLLAGRTATKLEVVAKEIRSAGGTAHTCVCDATDPSEIDGLEFAYLAGGEGPQVESKSGWDVDGVEIRVILDFGAGFIDHRGWFANAGA